MEKNKKKFKLKEPVRLRAKNLANGNRSLYLDTYNEGKRSYEFLRIYLVPEKSDAHKRANAAAMRAATSIKASRILAIINGKAEINTLGNNISLSDWIGRVIQKKAGQLSRSSMSMMKRLAKHVAMHNPGVLLKDIDRTFCAGFAVYLRSAIALNSAKHLAPSTQCELLNALSIILNEAVRGDFIQKNPMSQLSAVERIKKPESSREYLTPEEVVRMITVSKDNIKDGDDVAAFLFCCFCGLRYSDAVALKWENIIETTEGKEILVTMKKTRRMVAVPLSRQACSLLPKKDSPTDNVFKFPSYAITLRRLKKLAASIGINKKVTFHVSRHTFATMMLTAGADLYTISKLIGHSDIRTTQIYSKVVDSKKREAMTLLDRLF